LHFLFGGNVIIYQILLKGCNEVEKPDNEVMNRILNWPAHGDESLNQDFYLAPFYDRSPDGGYGGNGIYNPLEEGDYPWYDDIMGRDDILCGVDRRISLFGDETPLVGFQ
jgi:hypothetical protein